MNHSKFDEIKIPSQIDDIINQNIQRAIRDKQKPARKHRKMITALVASLLLFMVLGISNPAIASNIPFIKNIFEVLQDGFRYPGNYSKYSEFVGETVYSNGIAVTVADVLCDGEMLHITYIIKKDTPFPYRQITGDDGNILFDIQALNVKLLAADLKNGDTLISFAGDSYINGKFIDDDTFIGVTSYSLEYLNVELPTEFSFNVLITEITNKSIYALNKEQLNDITLGSWAFKIPITVQKDLRETLSLETTPSDFTEKIEMSLSPFNTYIDITFPFNIFERTTYQEAEFYDQNGNELIYFQGSSMNEHVYRYYLLTLDPNVTAIRIVLTEKQYIKLDETVVSYGVSETTGYMKTLGVVFDKTYPIK